MGEPKISDLRSLFSKQPLAADCSAIIDSAKRGERFAGIIARQPYVLF
jgi:hypothetical protein